MTQDRLPAQVEKGKKYRVREFDPEKGTHVEVEHEVIDIRENKTTDNTRGAVIIVARGRMKR